MAPISTDTLPFPALSAIASGHDLAAIVLVAHPDDETIAVGGRLWCWPSASVIHLTRGAPRDPSFAHRAGYPDNRAYAECRAGELDRALQVAGVPASHRYQLGHTDQETHLSLHEIVRDVASLVEALEPSVIITHAYEGGHPDHDSAAFAARAAGYWMAARGRVAPVIVESPFYHHAGATLAICEFLPVPGSMELELELDASQRTAKQDMFACFESQREVLAPFPTDRERFRIAPAYDFLQPPHRGPLHYEILGWPLKAESWRERARTALLDLGLIQPESHGSQLAVKPSQ